MSKMKLSEFNYELPEELIAKYPSENRDESRLMVVHKDTGKIEHKLFKDLITYFDEGDVMIMNNTCVFPARMYGNKEKTGAKIEVFLLRELNRDSLLWDVLVDPARKIRIGNKLYFGEDDSLVAEVIDNTTSRGRTLRFLFDGPYEDFKAKITQLGETPLPKYIKRDVEKTDEELRILALEIFDGLKMKTIYMDPKSHDVHVAYVSHLSHVSSFMLGKTVIEKEKNENNIFDLAGSGFESTVRLAKSHPKTWTPIFLQNKTNLAAAIDEYVSNLNLLKDLIINENDNKLSEILNNTNRIKEILNKK